MAKSYEELEQENYEIRMLLLDNQNWRDDGKELDKRLEELINKMMPTKDLNQKSRDIPPLSKKIPNKTATSKAMHK